MGLDEAAIRAVVRSELRTQAPTLARRLRDWTVLGLALMGAGLGVVNVLDGRGASRAEVDAQVAELLDDSLDLLGGEEGMAALSGHLSVQDENMLERVEQKLRRAYLLDPKSAAAHRLQGMLSSARGHMEDAMDWHLRAMSLDPEFSPSHNGLGLLLRDQGRVEEAIEFYRTALSIDPIYAMAHYNLGLALAPQGKTKEAIRELRHAVVLEPDDTAFSEALDEVRRLPEASRTEKYPRVHASCLEGLEIAGAPTKAIRKMGPGSNSNQPTHRVPNTARSKESTW